MSSRSLSDGHVGSRDGQVDGSDRVSQSIDVKTAQGGHSGNEDGSGEAEPLLAGGREGRYDGGTREADRDDGTTTWQGEGDFEGLSWWRRPSIYWLLCPYFLYTLALGGTIVPKLDLYLTLICREYLADRAAKVPGFTFTPVGPFDDSTQCRIPAVSAMATKFNLYITLISGILTAMASPKLGALSDRYGRKRVITLITIGALLNELVIILAAAWPDSINYHWILLGAVFDGACGSFIAGVALTNSYASDCTPPAQRAVAFAFFHACMFGGVALGPLIAGLVVKATGNILPVFYISFGAHTLFMMFIVFLLPESLTKKRQLAARERDRIAREAERQAANVWSKLPASNLLAPLKILYPTGPGTSPHLRMNLLLLSMVDAIIFGSAMGAMTVTIYYSKLQFSWNSYDSNMFVAILNSCRVSGLLIVFPCINYLLRTRPKNKLRRETGIEPADKQSGSDQLDLYIIRFSLLLEILGFTGYTAVRTGGLFTASGMLTSFGGMGAPTLQSALTKHVPQDRVGQLLGATGVLHALARVFCPLLFSLVYASTVETFRQTVFAMLSAFFAVAFTISWFLRPHIYLKEPGLATPNHRRDAQIEQEEEVLVEEEIAGI
ncbi:MAG: hypothetical protein M1818_000466 [Claussenomyces sp. TS43310]|nr:MAG: hypothetical protein M1818_000466 [Claussenomyces sp. TS43310]